MAETFEKLKELREKSGLRQGQIADYLDVTQTFISKVENGERNLTLYQLERLLDLYGYSLSDFSEIDSESLPIQFAFRAQELTQDDLSFIADIGKIVINSRFMAQLMEKNNVG